MKKLLSYFSFCLLTSSAIAQPVIEWEKSFGGSNTETVLNIINTPDGGYLVGSQTNSTNGDVSGNHGAEDMWLTKINSNGVKQWQKCLGGLESEGIRGMSKVSTGGYILTGNTTSNGFKNSSQVFGNRGGMDIWVVKVDDNGQIEWRQCFGGCDRDEARNIRETSDGNFVVVGGTMSFNSSDVYGSQGDWDGWIFKISPTGELLWQKTIGGSGIDYLFCIEETANGALVAAGESTSIDGDLSGIGNNGLEDLWIFQLSADGDLQWSKTYGGSNNDGARSICLLSNGDIVAAGITFSSNGDVTGFHGGSDTWVVRLNSTGDLLWQKAYGGSGDEYANVVLLRSDNDFIFAGENSSFDGDVVGYHGGKDAWVGKFDQNGVLKAQVSLGGSGFDFARGCTLGAGNAVIVGATSGSQDGDVSQNFGSTDAWIVKLSVPLGLKSEVPNPDHLELKLSPNPASSLIQITTNLVGAKQLELFDASGKRLQTLEMDEMNMNLPINHLPAGIYLVKMVTSTGQVLSAQFVKAG